MTREIKFRAWSADGAMIYFNLQDIDGGVVGNGEDCADLSKRDVMQYTGLKDKNGKEIYEGDVLSDSEGTLGEVSWRGTEWAIGRIKKINKDYDWPKWAVPSQGWPNMEVIGNIYENPELLQVAK